MKRKRFVKLVMSDGISRNTANKVAKIVQRKRADYTTAYIAYNNIAIVK